MTAISPSRRRSTLALMLPMTLPAPDLFTEDYPRGAVE